MDTLTHHTHGKANGLGRRYTSYIGVSEQRIALAMIVRRHVIAYKDAIKAAYEAHANSETSKEVKNVAGGARLSVPYRAGAKTTTALAQLIGLPLYDNASKAKPEPAKHLIEFMQAAGPAHFGAIYAYFRDHVITPPYRAAAPAWVQMAIHEVFDRHDDALVLPSPELSAAWERARYAPAAIIHALEETSPQLMTRLGLYKGIWHVLRYAHHGKRVVRLLMQVICVDGAQPRFVLYYRTRSMTVSGASAAYVTRGSAMLLKGGQHALFIGQEEEHQGQSIPDGYPLFITCPTRISRHAPFIGLVQRRHDDSKVFAIKAQFVPALSEDVDALLAQGKVGSFETPEEIATMASDIAGFEELMRELRRSADDQTGGLNL